ncbi:P-loop containing nucleoside triphosphate hydrolase protein [Parathielavia appendiculata]|uniref:ATP-dependent RNA helicase ROK1 n=1 Tax=Parathielavia appendiculata TaxID=2587402 RepID=A0AAN6UB36_9PEZI|nr:P-loop containing nucleoside triphosphate hydrolase protein [Parathielavia appendiculata]
MDILKVLSRGIKHNQKNKPQAAGTLTQLPSAGALPRPQLFHDPVSARGKKRKRRPDAQNDEQAVEDDDVSDVDYFAPKEPAVEPVPDTDQAPPKKRKIRLLDEDECRQILRSHRLKFTILSGSPKVEDKEDEQASKKNKRRKEAERNMGEKEKKDDYRKQIFPQPLNSFGELQHIYDVSPQLAANVSAQGFRVPTEVQMGSLPLLLRPVTALKKSKSVEVPGLENGAHFLAVAPTGSGKTITFLIPAIDGVLRRRAELGRDKDGHVLEVVVVAPTRELASQIVNEGRKLAIGTGVRVVLMKRGLRLAAEEVKQVKGNDDEGSGSEKESEDDASEESEDDKAGKDGGKPLARVDILVTTPKTLLNFLSGGKPGTRQILPTVRSLVLDEADVLLDPIFRKQTMGIWRACTHPEVSLTCWSATMASNIESLITKQLDKRSKRAGTTPRPVIRLVVGLKDAAVPNITHKLIYTATEPGKLLALRQLLHPVSSADSGPPLRPPFLVFTQTIERAQALHDELKYDIPLEAGGSVRVAVLHSSMTDRDRSKIMARFRAGEVWVLITTDVLARGVDFAGVNGVVNYDVPTSAAGYVHRAGRTGRAGREGGVAVTFYTKDDIPFVKSVANVIAASEKQAGKTEEGGGVQKWLLDALPKVAKEDKRKLKSSWERRREHNRAQAIEASKRRKRQRREEGEEKVEEEGEWGGLED